MCLTVYVSHGSGVGALALLSALVGGLKPTERVLARSIVDVWCGGGRGGGGRKIEGRYRHTGKFELTDRYNFTGKKLWIPRTFLLEN